MKINIGSPTLLITSLLWVIPASASDLVTFAPECQSHILHRNKEVSRDYTYLEFYLNPQPCYLQGRIGGEHQTFINVVSFFGEKYSVSLFDKQKKSSFSISGDGIKVLDTASENIKIIEIELKETFFIISPSAYPYGEYSITIKKL